MAMCMGIIELAKQKMDIVQTCNHVIIFKNYSVLETVLNKFTNTKIVINILDYYLLNKLFVGPNSLLLLLVFYIRYHSHSYVRLSASQAIVGVTSVRLVESADKVVDNVKNQGKKTRQWRRKKHYSITENQSTFNSSSFTILLFDRIKTSAHTKFCQSLQTHLFRLWTALTLLSARRRLGNLAQVVSSSLSKRAHDYYTKKTINYLYT